MNPLMLAAYLLAFAGDGITTDRALARGGQEAVLPTQSRPVITSIFVGQAALGYVAYRWLKPIHPKMARFLYGVTVSSHGIATVWNLHHLTK